MTTEVQVHTSHITPRHPQNPGKDYLWPSSYMYLQDLRPNPDMSTFLMYPSIDADMGILKNEAKTQTCLH